MRILGIDPGYGITGFGLIEGERGQFTLLRCGAITTPAGADFSARLEMIYEDMRELLRVCKPDCVAIEELFFGQNVTTGIGVWAANFTSMLAYVPDVQITYDLGLIVVSLVVAIMAAMPFGMLVLGPDRWRAGFLGGILVGLALGLLQVLGQGDRID